MLVESIEAGVEEKVKIASFLLGSFGEVRSLEEGELEGLFGPSRPPELGGDEAAVKIAAPPAELAAVLESVSGAAAARA